jgi:hypothetical protein
VGLVWWDWCVSITPFLALRSDAWEVRILHSHLAFRQSGRGEPQDPVARHGVGYCLGIGSYCYGPGADGEFAKENTLDELEFPRTGDGCSSLMLHDRGRHHIHHIPRTPIAPTLTTPI